MSVRPSVRASVQNRKAFIFNFFTQKLGGPAKQEGFHFYFFHTKIRGTSLNVHTIASSLLERQDLLSLCFGSTDFSWSP
jgi:hypothetical protein